MFFARRVILVEGIAEQTVLPELFEQTNGASLEGNRLYGHERQWRRVPGFPVGIQERVFERCKAAV